MGVQGAHGELIAWLCVRFSPSDCSKHILFWPFHKISYKMHLTVEKCATKSI